MGSDKIFKTALIISLIGHSIFLWGWSGFIHIFPDKSLDKPVEITYYRLKQDLPVKPQPKENQIQTLENFKIKDEPNKANLKITKLSSSQKKLAAIPYPENIKSSKDKSLYLDYYQGIREKIRSAASSSYYNYSQTGDVCLSFILNSDGTLKNIEICESGTNSTNTLKKIALNSVQEAAPFPSFPKGLNQKQLSFNVIISFERETKNIN